MGDYEDRVLAEAGEPQRLFAVEELADPMRTRVQDLDRWITEFQEACKPETLRKAAQYGSADLDLIGRAMLLMMPEERRDERMALLLGISFYLTGKVARIFGQIERGETPDQDSFYDANVYSMMALRVLQEGKWL